MRRNVCIWKEPSTGLQKRLSTPGCLEYKRRYDEYMNQPYEAGTTGSESDAEDDLDQFYESLDLKDKAALEEEMDLDELNSNVDRIIFELASNRNLYIKIYSVEDEQRYIARKRLKYVYPDYVDLVGPPSEEDFDEDGGYLSNESGRRLSDVRAVDLLLVGVFEWKGLYIARMNRGDPSAPPGWQVCLDPDYRPVDVLGVRRVGNKGNNRPALNPFYRVRTQWLHDYLFDCDVELGNRVAKEKNQYVSFKGGNPYNCLPDNLVLAEKRRRGRRMLCQSCGKETTKEDSMVIREGTQKPRYCLACLRWITDGA
jgi:hypothetical protein